ncbi:MAG: UvrD-helicase domain-containing protein, partial [Planctomycetota bacterium]
MKKIGWTKQQLKAIAEHNRDVFVTASAGTGKTAVLSGRCVDILGDVEKQIRPNISNLLVLTFTEAAAQEMRKRIAELLKERWENTSDPHIHYQMILLQGADIGTIHSFCKKIITENFYKLGIDPAFKVVDEDEQKLLKKEALDKTIDWAWEQENLQKSLKQLLSKRSLDENQGFLS